MSPRSASTGPDPQPICTSFRAGIRTGWLAATACAAAIAVWLSLAAPAATQEPAPAEAATKPKILPELAPEERNGPVYHVGQFPPTSIRWAAAASARGVKAVYPHPYVSQAAVMVDQAGLKVSIDWGKTFKEVPGGSADAIGDVNHVEFQPDDPSVFYIASQTKGIFICEGLGKSARQLAAKASGLASDCVSDVRVDGGDIRLRTLLAGHGLSSSLKAVQADGAASTAGLSRSLDGGKTWAALASIKDFHVDGILPGGPGDAWLYVLARKGADAAPCVYYARSSDDQLAEMSKDVLAAGWSCGVFQSQASYWATADAGILMVTPSGGNRDALPLAEELADLKWSSLAATYGSTADHEMICFFEPSKHGLVTLSRSAIARETRGGGFTPPHAAHGQNLPLGSFTRQGAHVRPSANGEVFYCVINGSLYIGRQDRGQPAVSDVRATPAVCTFSRHAYAQQAAELGPMLGALANERSAAGAAGPILEKFKPLDEALPQGVTLVTAKIDSKPAAVTVDLSRLGSSPRAPMNDAGVLGDQTAGDGVYTARVVFHPERLGSDWRDKRRWLPGPTGLTISAVAADGRLSTGVAVISAFPRPERWAFWGTYYGRPAAKADSGKCELAVVREAKGDNDVLKISTGSEPWAVSLGQRDDGNLQGYHAISFMIKSDRKAGAELSVQLRDASPDSLSETTLAVNIVKEGLIEGGAVSDTYRRVVIPISRLLQDSPKFRPSLASWVVISGGAGAAQTLWIDRIYVHPTAQDVKSLVEGGKK